MLGLPNMYILKTHYLKYLPYAIYFKKLELFINQIRISTSIFFKSCPNCWGLLDANSKTVDKTDRSWPMTAQFYLENKYEIQPFDKQQ